MRRLASPLLAVALLGLVACEDQAPSPAGPDDGTASTDVAAASSAAGTVDVIVQLDREFSPGAHASNKARAGEIAGELGVEPRFTYGTALFGFAGAVSEGRIGALEKDPRVILVERDFPVHAIEQTLPAGIDRIEADQSSTAAIDGSPTGVDVDIGIIDTGIDLDHGDLNAVDGVNCIDPDATADDDNGHGTHVAGSAAAIDDGSDVVGAAPGARVHAVKVLDSGGSGSISSVVCGIDWVTDNAGTIAVANMSLGAQGTSSTMRTSIQNSVDAGVFYAVAAGNDGQDVYGSDNTFGTSDDFIPASYPEAAAVSAMADYDGTSGAEGGRQLFPGCGWIYDDALADCFTNFSTNVVSDNPVSSPGAAIDVAAPGVSVLSTQSGGGTTTMTGTSMASPHVAGVAALYVAENGRASDASGVASIRQALIDAGQPQSDWQSGDTRDPDSNPERLLWALFGDTDSPPSVSITSPSDGATVSGQVSIEADATDDGSVTQVEFFVDGGSIGTDSDGSDGWSVDWNTENYADGDHTVTAEATDDAGQTASDQISVTVDNTDDPPSVTITNPSDGETVSGTVTVTADASDDGSVSQVDFLVDGSSIGTDSDGSDGWSVDWNTENYADGDHTVTAEATDDAGQTASDQISVTVDNTTSSSTMHVGDLDSNSINNGRTWTAEVTITVHDGSHDAVADATVSGSWSGLGSGSADSSACTTDSAGQCTVSASGIRKNNGSVTFTVDGLDHADLTYESTDNHDPDGDSDGTTITVSKP